jgi:hypothetical protein
MSGEFLALRHRGPRGETTLELIVRRTSCRAGVVEAAGPSGMGILAGLRLRTICGWNWAARVKPDGSTYLDPWLALVRLGPGEYEPVERWIKREGGKR